MGGRYFFVLYVRKISAKVLIAGSVFREEKNGKNSKVTKTDRILRIKTESGVLY